MPFSDPGSLELTSDLVPLTETLVTHRDLRAIRLALDVAGIAYAVHPPHRIVGESGRMRGHIYKLHTVYVRPAELVAAIEAAAGKVSRTLLRSELPDGDTEPAGAAGDDGDGDLMPLCELPWAEAFELSEILSREGVAASPGASEASADGADRTATVLVRSRDREFAEAAARRLLGDRFVPLDVGQA